MRVKYSERNCVRLKLTILRTMSNKTVLHCYTDCKRPSSLQKNWVD